MDLCDTVVGWVYLVGWLVCVVALVFVCFGCSSAVGLLVWVVVWGSCFVACLLYVWTVVALLLLIDGYVTQWFEFAGVDDFCPDSFCGLACCCGLCFAGGCLWFY